MTELTELTNDPEVVEGDGEANRWTKYGKDRVYLNDNGFSGKYDAYIDLKTGKFECEYPSDYRMEIEDGTATITKHWSSHGEDYSEVVVVVDLFDAEDDDEDNAGDEEKQLIADGGTDVEETDDDVKLLSTPAIRVEADSGVQVYEDALDAEIAVRDGDLPPGGIVWRQISAFDVDKLLWQEVPDFRDRLDETLENGDYDYVEEASRDTITGLEQSEIDSTGTYLFECKKCGHEECQSATELRLRCNLHRINDVYYHDDEGRIQRDDGHSTALWKLIGSGDIARLSEDERDETTTETPFVWAVNEMEIEKYGAEDADRSRIHDLIRDGLTPSEAVDYHMTVESDFTQDEWSKERGRSQQAISDNVRKAKEKLL
jgi:hypothetical protein